MKRIIAHWPVDRGTFNGSAAEHYHRYVDKNGARHVGYNKPEDNLNVRDGKYAAHARAANTGSIGHAAGGMAGATSEDKLGNYPVTKAAWDGMCLWMAEDCITYGIPVTPRTVLTHAEVQPTLGIKQNGKWDYTVVPHLPTIRGHKAVGDFMRAQVSANITKLKAKGYKGATEVGKETDAQRDRVRYLQRLLTRAGYPLGKIDGIIGKNTTEAVRLFAADHGLAFNPNAPFSKPIVQALRAQETAIAQKPPQPMIDHLTDLAVDGRTSKTQMAGALVSGTSGVAVAGQVATAVEDATRTGQSLIDSAMTIGPWVLLGLVVCAVGIWIIMNRKKDAEKAREAKDYLDGWQADMEGKL